MAAAVRHRGPDREKARDAAAKIEDTADKRTTGPKLLADIKKVFDQDGG